MPSQGLAFKAVVLSFDIFNII